MALVVCTLVTVMAVPSYAADFYGSKATVDMRYDVQYSCRAPADTSYMYFYFLTGEGDDWIWLGTSYMCVWSRERLVIDGNKIVFEEPFYYAAASSLNSLENAFFNSSGSDKATLYVSTDSFTFDSIEVIYSNKSYVIDDKSHSPYWPYAVEGGEAAALGVFFSSIYNSLTANGINIFGTKVSFFAIIAGPFIITISLLILSNVFGVGRRGHGVRESKNTKTKKKGGDSE